MTIAATSVSVYVDASISTTSTAARLTSMAVHENQRRHRPTDRWTTGAMIRVPPRKSTSTRTIDKPANENGSVVVAMIVARQTPNRNVSRRGKGTLTPKNERRPAYFHQRA